MCCLLTVLKNTYLHRLWFDKSLHLFHDILMASTEATPNQAFLMNKVFITKIVYSCKIQYIYFHFSELTISAEDLSLLN